MSDALSIVLAVAAIAGLGALVGAWYGYKWGHADALLESDSYETDGACNWRAHREAMDG